MRHVTLLQRYLEWLRRAKRNGAALTSYLCASCSRTLETSKPERGDVYDSMSVCPYCDAAHFKIVHDDGRVEQHKPQEVRHAAGSN